MTSISAIKNKIGHLIELLMESAGFRKEQIANILGISAPTLNSFLNGTGNYGINTLLRTIYIFGLRLDEITKMDDIILESNFRSVLLDYHKKIKSPDYLNLKKAPTRKYALIKLVEQNKISEFMEPNKIMSLMDTEFGITGLVGISKELSDLSFCIESIPDSSHPSYSIYKGNPQALKPAKDTQFYIPSYIKLSNSFTEDYNFDTLLKFSEILLMASKKYFSGSYLIRKVREENTPMAEKKFLHPLINAELIIPQDNTIKSLKKNMYKLSEKGREVLNLNY